jgi:hypothetical protein
MAEDSSFNLLLRATMAIGPAAMSESNDSNQILTVEPT